MEREPRLSKVQFIGDGAFFSDSVSLETVVLASSVKSIGDGAFSNCSRLTSVVLPSSLTRIERESFLGCYSLKSIVIPSSVETIEDGAFEGCNSLTNTYIPSSVTSIGKEAFASSFSDVLLNLRFESPKPPYVDKFIASEYSKIRIIVPKGAREAYIKANLVANAECIVEE